MGKNVLYNIPSNWVWTTIEDIGFVVSGGTPSTKDPEFWGEDISWVTPADLSNYSNIFISKGKRSLSKLGLEYSSAVLLPANSVLFSSRAPIGYVAIAKNELATNQGFKNIIPSSYVNPKYIYFYLKTIKDLAEDLASGTTFLEISAAKFKSIQFPLASPQEQDRIVDKIEEIFSEIDKSLIERQHNGVPAFGVYTVNKG
jgi:type I restriction enzyme S subunit